MLYQGLSYIDKCWGNVTDGAITRHKLSDAQVRTAWVMLQPRDNHEVLRQFP